MDNSRDIMAEIHNFPINLPALMELCRNTFLKFISKTTTEIPNAKTKVMVWLYTNPVKPKIMSHGLEKPSYIILYNPAMTIGKNIVANVSPTAVLTYTFVIIVCDVKNKIADTSAAYLFFIIYFEDR